MKQTLKIISWIQIVMGGLAILGWAGDPADGYALVGGLLYVSAGVVALAYIRENREE